MEKRFLSKILIFVLVVSSIQVFSLNNTADAKESSNNSMVFNGHSYTVYNEALNWGDARDYCESQGGHLITINSKAEQDMLDSLLSQAYLEYHGYWMGGRYSNNSWQWITGEPFTYTNFDDNEPNGSGDYLQTYTSGLWDDTIYTGVSRLHGFICEWDNSISESVKNNSTVLNGHTYTIYNKALTVSA